MKLTQVEKIAKRFKNECLIIEFVRGVLLPQNRALEAIKILNRVHSEIQSSVRGRKPRSPLSVLLWAMTALELGELGAKSSRIGEGVFVSRVEKTLEQICDDRASGLAVASSGLLNFDLAELSGDSPGAFEVQCVWINALFLLGKKRPKWIVLQQMASASFLQTYFPEYSSSERIAKPSSGSVEANRILALGRFPCVLVPYEIAKQLLEELPTSLLRDAQGFDRLYLPAVAEAQKRIFGETDTEVVAMIQEIQNDLESRVDSIATVADSRLAIELERWRQKKGDSFEIAHLKRRRKRFVSEASAIRSATETVQHAIESTIGQYASELSVVIEGLQVVVRAKVPSYYLRQLVEQNSRTIVEKHLRKQFVSKVVVDRNMGR